MAKKMHQPNLNAVAALNASYIHDQGISYKTFAVVIIVIS
jgi:hypothetical protein